MRKLIPIFLLFISSLIVFARIIVPWTKAEMQKASDVIVIGRAIKVVDLNETNSVLWSGNKFVGVDTTFAVIKVLKGNYTNQTIVLRHYRFDPPNSAPPNAPCFAKFIPNSTNQYLLYLVKDGTNRFAPVSGQTDPAADAVRKFSKK